MSVQEGNIPVIYVTTRLQSGHISIDISNRYMEGRFFYVNFATTRREHLKTHYTLPFNTCNSCDYQSTTSKNIGRHRQSLHEGKKYPFDICDYQATRRGHLTTHKQSMHEGKKFSCESCDYQATTSWGLGSHKQWKHKERKHAGAELCQAQVKLRLALLI
jgi:KRAB domain-containing zinc finger protein